MSMMNSQTAHREYMNRPADERFESLSALVESATADKIASKVKTYNIRDLRAAAMNLPINIGGASHPASEQTVVLESQKGYAPLTHWAFSQLSRMIGAPAGYLRSLSPVLIAECINHGIRHTADATDVRLLLRSHVDRPYVTARACTSDAYGQLYDADLYRSVNESIVQPSNGAWTSPPTWGGEACGFHRGDRDSFVFLTNGGSIVKDPSAPSATSASGVDSQAMYRGFMLRNSEVGASRFLMEEFWFRAVCGNHLIMGGILDRQYKRRHIGANTLRDAIREVSHVAWNWTNASTERDNAVITGLIRHEIGITKEAVISELRKLGATAEQATAAYDLCEQKENASPRSYWGVSQGLTRLSQLTEYQDARYALDKIAAATLAQGARKVFA